MALTNKQKKHIRDHHRKKSAEQLSREMKCDLKQIREYLELISPATSAKRKIVFPIMALLIPVLFFLLLEDSLRLFNYRGDTRLFVFPEEYYKGEYGFANRNFNARYFFNTRPEICPVFLMMLSSGTNRTKHSGFSPWADLLLQDNRTDLTLLFHESRPMHFRMCCPAGSSKWLISEPRP